MKDDGYKELFKILVERPKKKITPRLLKVSKKKNVCSEVLAECLTCLKCS
jgi:hypothetical protein